MKIFLYPLRASPLMLILVVTVVIWMVMGNAFYLLVVSGVVTVAFPAQARYLFVVIDHTANGHNDPPQLDAKTLRPISQWRPFQLVVVLAFGITFMRWLSSCLI